MIFSSEKNLIWIDLEMTGLNPDVDRIIEIATLVTDSNLNILSVGPNIVIFQKKEILDQMNEWNVNIHTSTGLLNKVKSSLINESDAEFFTISFLKKWVPKGISPICGSTVAQDRRFLFRYMPNLESYFNYRYVDVSTLKELIIRWFPKFKINLNKKKRHTALSDIKYSVNELVYYRKYFFNNNFCGNSSVGRV